VMPVHQPDCVRTRRRKQHSSPFRQAAVAQLT
jgi:hypothetical protein